MPIFTPDQVESINAYQRAGVFHPFTCGTEGCGTDLVAHEEGLRCPRCAYTQDWVHGFMADWSWVPPEDQTFHWKRWERETNEDGTSLAQRIRARRATL